MFLGQPNLANKVANSGKILDISAIKPHVKNPYGRALTIVVSPPDYLYLAWKTGKPINAWEQSSPAPIISKAIEEHKRMVEAAQAHGTQVFVKSASKRLYESTYTCDLGFVVDETFVKARMHKHLVTPKGEIIENPRFLEPSSIKCANEFAITKGTLEGGDVILSFDSRIFVGLSSRTSAQAIKQVQEKFPHKEIFAFELAGGLHLDCGFADLPKKSALIYPSAFRSVWSSDFKKKYDPLKFVKSIYKRLHVLSKAQYEELGTNVQIIDEETMFSGNGGIGTLLKSWGFNPIVMSFEELHKGGGSYRCCSLVIARED